MTLQWLLSGQEDGATFLIAYPDFGKGLTNEQFTILINIKARIGLPTVIDCNEEMDCPGCFDIAAPGGGYRDRDITGLWNFKLAKEGQKVR